MTDLKHAFRDLWARPGFSLLVLVPLSLGIGFNTAIFSAVYTVLLRSLPYDRPEALVRVWEARPRMGPEAAQMAAFSMDHFRAWRDDNSVFEAMAVYGDASFNLTGGTEFDARSLARFFDMVDAHIVHVFELARDVTSPTLRQRALHTFRADVVDQIKIDAIVGAPSFEQLIEHR